MNRFVTVGAPLVWGDQGIVIDCIDSESHHCPMSNLVSSLVSNSKKTARIHKWSPLQPGDIVDVVAPASASTEKDLQLGMNFVESLGLIPRRPKAIFGRDVTICSNTDEKRFEHLKKALQAKDSKAIWCLRGGYGSARLLPQLEKLPAPKSSKLFIGYSDITALHNFFNNKWKWPTLHANMLESLGLGEGGRREIYEIRGLIFGHQKDIEFNSLKSMNSKARQLRVMRSKVVGGNFTVLMSLFGTPWQYDVKGKILFVEDIGERGYRIDRMLVQMLHAGYFKGLKAFIFGDFIGGAEDDCSYTWKEVQKQFAKHATFPVLKGLPCGHGVFQRPIPLGTPAELKLGRKPCLRVKAGF